MILDTLRELVPGVSCSTVPCDLSDRSATAVAFADCDFLAVTIYDPWGRERARLLESAGCKVRVLWERKVKLTTGTEVRAAIRGGLAWEHLVPRPAARVISEVLETRSL